MELCPWGTLIGTLRVLYIFEEYQYICIIEATVTKEKTKQKETKERPEATVTKEKPEATVTKEKNRSYSN